MPIAAIPIFQNYPFLLFTFVVCVVVGCWLGWALSYPTLKAADADADALAKDYDDLLIEHHDAQSELWALRKRIDMKVDDWLTRQNLPSYASNPRGLHCRYLLAKASGKPLDPASIYFLLRLDDGASPEHQNASREAAELYAVRILESKAPHLHPMAEELQKLIRDLDEGTHYV